MTEETTPATPAMPSPDPTAPATPPAAPAGGWRDKLEHGEEELREDLSRAEHRIGDALHRDHGTGDPKP